MTDTPHYGAKGALFVGIRLITILRDDIPTIVHPGLWDLPGGGREPGEDTFQTFAREVEEELGLTITRDTILWETHCPAEDKPGGWVAFFVARLDTDAPARIRFGDEGQGWALMEVWDFLRLPNRVPHYGHRLGMWLDETGGAPLLDPAAPPRPTGLGKVGT